jgi:hypothetical protein
MELPSTSSLTNSCGDLCHETRVRLAASTRHFPQDISQSSTNLYIYSPHQPAITKNYHVSLSHIHHSATRNKWVLLSAEVKEIIHSFISVQLKPEACISKSQSIPYRLTIGQSLKQWTISSSSAKWHLPHLASAVSLRWKRKILVSKLLWNISQTKNWIFSGAWSLTNHLHLAFSLSSLDLVISQ